MKLTTENPTAEQAAETRVYGKITRRLIPFLILCYSSPIWTALTSGSPSCICKTP